MPIQPNDRYQQDPERLWRVAETAGRFPAQPRYAGTRTAGDTGLLPWAELNDLPAGRSSRSGLNSH
ncbi:DNA repair protein [Micromonospora sp. GCM10011542]|uniref:DNA repair protein n=1 Tax=Micromonospora sp. GCM10011542 TaxID=3317337 RepID=UPI00361E8F85